VVSTANNQHIGTAPANALWNLGSEMSAEFWVRYRSFPGNISAMAVSNVTGTSGWSCRTMSDEVRALVSYGVGITPAFEFQTGTWYHVACQYDGTTIRVFVNGTLIGSGPQTGPVENSGGVLRVAAWNECWDGSCGGGGLYTDMDYRGIRVGNQNLYTTDFTPAWNLPPTTGTVAAYPVDEGSGSTLSDLTGSAPDITLEGTYTWGMSGEYCEGP
jgi:hypothetical protein